MSLQFTPDAPWTDAQLVQDQHGNYYRYDADCNTMRPVALAGQGSGICPSASVESGDAPTTSPTAPVTPPSSPVNGQIHFETYDDQRNTFCYSNGWTFVDYFELGGVPQDPPPCPSGSVESGNASPIQIGGTPTAPVTPPSNPSPGQVHYQIWDDAIDIFCYTGATWFFSIRIPLVDTGGITLNPSDYSGAQTGGTGSGPWTGPGVGGGTITSVPLLRKSGNSYGLFTLTLNDSSGDP